MSAVSRLRPLAPIASVISMVPVSSCGLFEAADPGTWVWAAAGTVGGVDVPGSASAVGDYRSMVLSKAVNRTRAQVPVACVLSGSARVIFAAAGFGKS